MAMNEVYKILKMQRKFCAVTIEVSATQIVNPAIKKKFKADYCQTQFAAGEKNPKNLFAQKASKQFGNRDTFQTQFLKLCF